MTFLDTNIFVYLVSGAPEDEPKRTIARNLVWTEDFGISVQVLQEFMHVTLRKKSLGLKPDEIQQMVESLSEYPVVETSVLLAKSAFEISQRYETSYWDAGIIAAALELGADTLYSEDLNSGQDYRGVRVINPFA